MLTTLGFAMLFTLQASYTHTSDTLFSICSFILGSCHDYLFFFFFLMIFSFTSNKIGFHKPGKIEFTVSLIFLRYIKCYFSKKYAASFRQNPHVYFLTVLQYILLMGHFFAVSVLQSITKG